MSDLVVYTSVCMYAQYIARLPVLQVPYHVQWALSTQDRFLHCMCDAWRATATGANERGVTKVKAQNALELATAAYYFVAGSTCGMQLRGIGKLPGPLLDVWGASIVATLLHVLGAS